MKSKIRNEGATIVLIKTSILITALFLVFNLWNISIVNCFESSNYISNSTNNLSSRSFEQVTVDKNELNQKGFDDESDDKEHEFEDNMNNFNFIDDEFNENLTDSGLVNNSTNNNGTNPIKKNGNNEDYMNSFHYKLLNESFKMDNFFARDVFDMLYSLFEPASEKVVNFLEVNKNLTRIIDTSKSQSNIADSYWVLTYLWFYGIPNKHGKNEFPYGWPRNIDIAIRYALKGATKHRCGFCYTVLGMLFAWGYPPLVNNTHGWLGVDNSTSRMNILGTSSSLKNIYFLYQVSYKYGNYMNSEEQNFPVERSGFDLVSMNYALASKNKDIFGQLANSYYLRYNLSELSYLYNQMEKSSGFSLHRIPRNLTSIVGTSSSSSRCIMALEPLIYVASRTLSEHIDLFLPDIGTILREKKLKEHETKHYAEWVRSLAADRDPDGLTSLGELYYYGHEAGGIARDVNRAAQLWEESARRGDPQGAMARAFLNLDGTMGTERDSAPYLRQVARYGEPSASALANYYIYKLGLNVDKNSTIAGEYLKLAADLGDGNAQLILAHAYAGGKMGVIPPGGQNETMALKYYKLSAEGGRTVAFFNSAVLTLKGSDRKYRTEESRCIASIDYLTHVVKKNNQVKLLSLLSKKSFENGDIVGSLLREMTLSELGIIEGHINSQDLWKERSIRIFEEGIKYLSEHKVEIKKQIYRPEICLDGVLSPSINFIKKYNSLIFKMQNCAINNEKMNISTLYPSKFDLQMNGLSSDYLCLTDINPKIIFFNVPINFDSIINLRSIYFKYFDPLNNLNATQRGDLDVNYSLKQSLEEKSRVADFLSCWMRPESYYSSLKNGYKNHNYNNGTYIQFEQDQEQYNSRFFDSIIYIWLKPLNGSYKKYPKPWYKTFNYVMNFIKYLSSFIFFNYIFSLDSFISNWIYSEEDLVLSNQVPKKYHLQRNSSLWCSHYYTRRSSSNGDILSTHNLIHHFLEGSYGVNRNYKAAFEFIMQGVNSRDPKSILDYAIALHRGIGVKKDKSKSYRLLWHIIARGPFNIEDILPKVPSGPRFVPTILDTIREAIVPLMKNGTNPSKIDSSIFSSQLLNNNFNDTEDFNEDIEDEDSLDQEYYRDFRKRKNRRTRNNDSVNLNLRTQYDFATRISSVSILLILTLDWFFNNYIFYYYQATLIFKNSLLSIFNDQSLEDQDHYITEIYSENDKVENYHKKSDNDNFPLELSNENVATNNDSSNKSLFNLFLNITNLKNFSNYKISANKIIGNYNSGNSLESINTHNHELIFEEDPFPFSSRFRYISDEEYNKASNIWKASIPIRIYYFIIRVIIIIAIISVLIPINIAITEKISQ